jgi:hypothetical protein
MIPELDRYHGIVLRQILLSHPGHMTFGVADISGRKDAFYVNAAAFQIKHSSKRLPPWQFTYLPENVAELDELGSTCEPVWIFLVCGVDGVVGLSVDELRSIIKPGAGGVAWVRVSRERNAMYRVCGSVRELPRAIPRGVQAFVSAVRV